MPELLGTKGAELDLLVRQGATQGPYSTRLKKADGTDLDITGAVFTAMIRKTPDSVPIPGVTFSFNITNAAIGEYSWSLPAGSTEKLNASEESENDPDSIYVWDMEVELADGRVLPLIYGKVYVFREVSKEEV